MSQMFNLFGKKKEDPVEQAKKWRRELNKEARHLDRDIDKLRQAERKAMDECKKLAKGGNVGAAKILAKEIVGTRKAVDRMYSAKAQLSSVSMQLQTTSSMIKMQGCLTKSADVMHCMNQLVSIPELKGTMMSMATEMERSGLIDEIVDDAFATMEPAELEGQADAEVNKIVDEITAGILSPAGAAPVGGTAQKAAAQTQPEEVREDVAEDNADLKAMQDRLAAL